VVFYITVTAEVVSLISSIALIFSDILDYFGDILTLFTTNPLLLLGVGLFFIGGVIGLTMRLISRS